MRQGASRHALRERRDDLYETPACCVTSAFREGVFSDAGSVIWEPCAGRGAIARELRAFGFSVIAQDLVDYEGADAGIETGIDFLMERRAPEGVTAIITNPPFKLADDVIRHGLTLVPRVIVLLRAVAIEGAGRADLIDHHLQHYWIGIDRPPAMHREGWTGNRLSNSGAPFAWFDFSARQKGARDPINMHRFRWRGGAVSGSLRILVTCEFSGNGRRAFTARESDVWSCDLVLAEGRSINNAAGDKLHD